MKTLAFLTFGATLAGGFYLYAFSYAQPNYVPIRPQPVTHPKFDPGAIARNIKLHEGRVKRDPSGPIGWAMLADAYLAESREYDRDTAAWRAEAAARKSLSLRQRGNSRAMTALVSSLLEQHRFQDALHALDGFDAKEGHLRADVLIEVGRYEDAEQLIAKLKDEDPAKHSAKARLSLLMGHPEVAATELERARRLVAQNPGTGEQTLAWYDVKLGDVLLAQGRTTEARTSYQRAVSLHPRSYKAHLALARLGLQEKQSQGAIEEGLATLQIANSLDARAAIGDAYAQLGNSNEANKWYLSCRAQFQAEVKLFDSLKKGGPLHVRPIDRQFATFATSHRLWLEQAVAPARRDLANRPDPHAHQVMALLHG